MKFFPTPNSSLNPSSLLQKEGGHFTSAEGERKIPGGSILHAGVAREHSVALQEEARVAAVPHFVPDAERRSLLHTILQPAWVPTRVTG